MKIVDRRVYRGPSQYAHFPVMRLTVDLGELERWPSAKIGNFNTALLEALPSLDQHSCSYGEPGGFIRRLTEDEGTWLGHVLEHVAIEVQQLAGAAVLAPGFGLTNRVVIDQHFRQRDRLGRLLSALAYNPFAVGLGIDEDTAAFIHPDDRIEIVGSSATTIVDVSALTHSSMATSAQNEPICMTGIRLHILTNGSSYDLRTREAKAPPPTQGKTP